MPRHALPDHKPSDHAMPCPFKPLTISVTTTHMAIDLRQSFFFFHQQWRTGTAPNPSAWCLPQTMHPLYACLAKVQNEAFPEQLHTLFQLPPSPLRKSMTFPSIPSWQRCQTNKTGTSPTHPFPLEKVHDLPSMPCLQRCQLPTTNPTIPLLVMCCASKLSNLVARLHNIFKFLCIPKLCHLL